MGEYIVNILSGPYSNEGYVWLLAEVQQSDGSITIEEIYYDSLDDAYEDLQDTEMGLCLPLEEDYLTESEEKEIDSWE